MSTASNSRQANAGWLPVDDQRIDLAGKGVQRIFRAPRGVTRRALPLLQDRDLPGVVEVVLDDSVEENVAGRILAAGE